MNIIKTGFLLVALTILMVVLGRALGGNTGMLIALILAILMNFGSLWFSDKLAIAMANAVPVQPQEAPGLYSMLQKLTLKANIPMPKLYISPSEQPNAFATGRNPSHAAVVINEGLLNMLSAEEVEGVVAHELAHIKNRDTLIMTVAATIAGAITYSAHLALFFGFSRDDDGDSGNPLVALLMFLLAPIAALLIQMAISRSREYEADKIGSAISGKPLSLASALKRLESGVETHPAQVSPSQAPLYIVNPLTGGGISSWFSTHPPIDERVRKLREIAGLLG